MEPVPQRSPQQRWTLESRGRPDVEGEPRSPSRSPSSVACCAWCRRPEGGDAVRGAVEAAFAEVQPALLQAVSRLVAELLDRAPGQRAAERHWSRLSTLERIGTTRADDPKAERSCSRPSTLELTLQERAARGEETRTSGEPLGQKAPDYNWSRPSTTEHERATRGEDLRWNSEPMPRRVSTSSALSAGGLPPSPRPLRSRTPDQLGDMSRPSSMEYFSEDQPVGCRLSSTSPEFVSRQVSSRSFMASPTTTMYSLGRPTVQSLQADVAEELLETSGLSRFARYAVGRDRTQVVPEPEREGVEAEGRVAASLSWAVSPTASRLSSISSRTSVHSRVLQVCIDEIEHDASSIRAGSSDCSIPKTTRATPVPAALCVLGVLDIQGRPWASAACRGATRALVASAAAAWLLRVLAPPEALRGLGPLPCHTAGCGQPVSVLSDVSLPLAAALALVSFGLPRQQRRLENAFWLAWDISVQRGYNTDESRRQRWDAAIFLFVWLCSVAAAALDGLPHKPLALVALRVGLTALFSAVVLCLAYGMARICRSLIVMVDTFSCDVVGSMQLQQVAHVWNLTQAMLRKVSSDVESGLLMLCFILAFSVPLLAIDVASSDMHSEEASTVVTVFSVTCGVLYALVLAAMVSEKCARIPALINAVSFGPGTELARQQTVDYVTSSAAGLYVIDMRLTIARVAALVYICCLVVIVFLARLSSR